MLIVDVDFMSRFVISMSGFYFKVGCPVLLKYWNFILHPVLNVLYMHRM